MNLYDAFIKNMFSLIKGVKVLSTSKLQGVVPDNVLGQVDTIADKFGISSDLRLAHFLSQCSHESGNFKVVKENLNYSVDGLLKIFPRFFDDATAHAYAMQPQKIASKVYAGRMGNGPESSGNGWAYCGRGYIQLTGKANYTLFSSFIGEDCVASPDLIATKYPLASAAYFFNSNKLWSICDLGKDSATVTLVTKRVNGGINGLDDRLRLFNLYSSILGI